MDKQKLRQRVFAVIEDDAATEGEKAAARRVLKSLDRQPPNGKSVGWWHLLSPIRNGSRVHCGDVDARRVTDFEFVKTWSKADLIICPMCLLAARGDTPNLAKA